MTVEAEAYKQAAECGLTHSQAKVVAHELAWGFYDWLQAIKENEGSTDSVWVKIEVRPEFWGEQPPGTVSPVLEPKPGKHPPP